MKDFLLDPLLSLTQLTVPNCFFSYQKYWCMTSIKHALQIYEGGLNELLAAPMKILECMLTQYFITNELSESDFVYFTFLL